MVEQLLSYVGAPGEFVVLSWIAYEVFRLRLAVESLTTRTVDVERKVAHVRPNLSSIRTGPGNSPPTP